MFNLFKKKEPSIKVIDKIWMTEQAKYNGLLRLSKDDPSIIIVSWFDSTLRHLDDLFARETTSPAPLLSVRTINSQTIAGHRIIFAEHHPMRKKEQDAFERWHLKEAIVHSAMDEPLFKHFGGERITGMMKQLGMKDDNMIEHKLISHAIENAQEKIGKKIMTEQSASSQQEWIDRNLGAGSN